MNVIRMAEVVFRVLLLDSTEFFTSSSKIIISLKVSEKQLNKYIYVRLELK
jgi:hypothetical protein